MQKLKNKQTNWLKTTTEIALLIGVFFVSSAYADGLAPGSTMLTTVAAWLKGLGVITCTIAIMVAGYKYLFQQARLKDVSDILIGGILIGSSSIIAGIIIA